MSTLTLEQLPYNAMDPGSQLSDALYYLKQQHEFLEADLLELQMLARSIGTTGDRAALKMELHELKVRAERFLKFFQQYQQDEQETLFPIVDLYTGDKMGPTAVMKQEYKMAVHNLRLFFQACKEEQSMESLCAKRSVSHVLQSCFILLEHMRKEKEWVFPLAEQMLTDIEQFYS
ncbi:hemerythrin domain-containing protein [Paenibacillus sp. FJAT-26967]|uniref:hemerythrin domain-containing protein n=1 Tax=Paenibacillus sp. FJAT-26967 TaxID=1729690 RepID=UPI000838CF22|nr:hemerythrin domain-containing protein [Paenibacillus sp. FJAT-26967]